MVLDRVFGSGIFRRGVAFRARPDSETLSTKLPHINLYAFRCARVVQVGHLYPVAASERIETVPMEFLTQTLDVVLHLNLHIGQLVSAYGPWVYALLFVIVFCETGLVVTPFLPGDSLLFAAGAVSASGGLDPFGVGLVVLGAAVAGDSVNYAIGQHSGGWLSTRLPRLVRPEHIQKTNVFYQRYGGKAVVFARFVPIVRTFAPFVAGIGRMQYAKFMKFNVLGALLWVCLLVPAGYFFANIEFVKQRFSLVILAIIGLSLAPAIFEVWKARRQAATALPPR